MFVESAARATAGHMACRDAARPLRRPEEREEHRRFLHKSNSPNWKDALDRYARQRGNCPV